MPDSLWQQQDVCRRDEWLAGSGQQISRSGWKRKEIFLKPVCKICRGDTTLIKKQSRKPELRRLYWRCLNCDFIFMDDRFILTPEQEISIYENHENSIDDPEYVAYFSRFIEHAILNHKRTENPVCLDFGSGPEPVLAQILRQQFGWQADIYDKFYAADTTYIGKTYDLITSTEVAEHLDDPMHYFRLFKKLLNPGGILAVMTLLHPSDDEAFKRWFYIRDMSHISFYSRRTMQQIAADLDLDIVYCDGHRHITFAAR